MRAKTVLFLISGMAFLIAISVVLNFVMYLAIAFGSIIVIGIVVLWKFVEDLKGRFMRVDFSTPVSERLRDDSVSERKLRNKIEKEWDRQSGFGNAEDLR